MMKLCEGMSVPNNECLPPFSGQPLMSFVASVMEEKDFWRNCLLEIKAGYEMADGRKK